MKIALLTEKYTPDIGGLAISSERLACLLTSAGYEVRVFSPTFSLPPSEQRTLPSSGVVVTRFGTRFDTRKRADDTLVDWLDLITEEHAREPFDILHAYFLTQAGFIATLAGRYLNIPSVVSIRGNDVDRAAFDPARFSHTMFALQNANVVTANAKESIRKAKAFFDREIILIPNSVDTNHFKPMGKNLALLESLGLERKRKEERSVSGKWIVESDEAVIGFVGELREKKGLKTLLSAYAQINAKRLSTLLIVGEVRHGEDSQTVEEMRASNPESKIIVTGYVSPSDLPAYYSLIDVFVHPSIHDGMPNAILEAMACEKAIIATPVGGIKDIVENGKNGMLVSVNDANALAEKILELLDDREKCESLGKSAREFVMSKFKPEAELMANLEVYRKLGL
ncbi:MAG TPA: glycosyltransferase family 4 protein [Anaerolineales bacterium]|nr:glycosyltransferase family 4 protein [Anaerolineales bacterium]HNQ94986.1 glycosyltransferase family 4 protein [Anaerolineales bacterium]HNS61649.1 glycosyltransferase family 4 protein [Anaerolineales bacterium]